MGNVNERPAWHFIAVETISIVCKKINGITFNFRIRQLQTKVSSDALTNVRAAIIFGAKYNENEYHQAKHNGMIQNDRHQIANTHQ